MCLVHPAEHKSIAISCDTLVENVHFLPDMPAQALGYKALAVNLSDLAAMGAEPAWMTLALTMPSVDETWLEQFSAGLFEAADYYGISLVGGDTTRGPRAINITVHGQVPEGKALTRSGARAGDWIYVTGSLGDSALGLDIIRGELKARAEHKEYLVNRHYHPSPRVLAGQSLRGLASSAIDLSDGLLSDIKHILKASAVGAVIEVDKLPLSQAMKDTVTADAALDYASVAAKTMSCCSLCRKRSAAHWKPPWAMPESSSIKSARYSPAINSGCNIMARYSSRNRQDLSIFK